MQNVFRVVSNVNEDIWSEGTISTKRSYSKVRRSEHGVKKTDKSIRDVACFSRQDRCELCFRYSYK